MKKVAIFTTFFETASGYSLIGVADNQIKMLLEHGYDPRVLVLENFKSDADLWQPEKIDLRKCIPFFHLDRGIVKDFEDRVKSTQKALEENLEGIDVCITHDIIFQDWYKEFNVAMRQYAKTRPELLWLNWIHSCPSPKNVTTYPLNCLYTPPPGYIIYPNDVDKGRVCQTYHLEGQEWRVKVNRSAHSIDPLTIWPYDKLTVELAQKSGLVESDIGIVYPTRLDKGKQPEKIIMLLAGMNQLGKDARLLIIDWQSTGNHFQKYIDKLIQLSEELGVGDKVNFTSRLDDRCSQGVPRKVVVELMDLSSVYVHPSKIETYSLVCHEAMLRGNLVVLNYDLPVMREIFGDNAIYMDFGSDRTSRKYDPDEKAFWANEAKRLASELNQNKALLARNYARKNWNPQKLWSDFETLFYLQEVGE